MAMGKRRRRGRQPSMWVSSSDLPRSAGHPFYERLNRVLDASGFDAFVEEQCAKFYADGVGRPSLAPGRYFRMLLLGYFEGLDSERAIAWRAADSLSLRQFLDVSLDAAPPDHSTVSRTRRRIAVETHLAVFTWVLQRLADAGLVGGKTVGIGDGSQCGASQHRRARVTRRFELAAASTPRRRAPSWPAWTGRTRLAHKAEHAVDLETGAVVGVSVQDADAGDTQTMLETLVTAAEQVDVVLPAGPGMGKRRRRGRQPSMWVSSSDLPRSAGHPFYERLNRVLDASGFDAFVEEQCAKFYADGARSAEPGAGPLLPDAAARLLRGGWTRNVRLRGGPPIR